MAGCRLPPGMCPVCGAWSEDGAGRGASGELVALHCGCSLEDWLVVRLGAPESGRYQVHGVCVPGCGQCRVPVAWRPCPGWWTARCGVCGPELAVAVRDREQAVAWADRHLLLTGHVECEIGHHAGRVVSVWPGHDPTDPWRSIAG